MALRLKKDVQKASYYVWFLGAQEARGLRGSRVLLPAIPRLVERSTEQEPLKVTLQVSHKGLKIIQVSHCPSPLATVSIVSRQIKMLRIMDWWQMLSPLTANYLVTRWLWAIYLRFIYYEDGRQTGTVNQKRDRIIETSAIVKELCYSSFPTFAKLLILH